MLRIFATTVLCLSGLFAQSADQIDGFVADQSGARIAGAAVSLRIESTVWKATTISGADGTFRFLHPPAGGIELRVEHAGFQPFAQKLDRQAVNTSGIAVTLSTASARQTVKVSGASGMLQTQASSQTSTISSRQLENLPTASRNYTHLIVGEAGVSASLPDRTGRGMNLATSPGSQGDDGTQSINPSVNGHQQFADDQRRGRSTIFPPTEARWNTTRAIHAITAAPRISIARIA